MERLFLKVENIQRPDPMGPCVATVRATSHEYVGKAPRAVIELTIRLDEEQSRASESDLLEIARDEALRFLDIA